MRQTCSTEAFRGALYAVHGPAAILSQGVTHVLLWRDLHCSLKICSTASHFMLGWMAGLVIIHVLHPNLKWRMTLQP